MKIIYTIYNQKENTYLNVDDNFEELSHKTAIFENKKEALKIIKELNKENLNVREAFIGLGEIYDKN